jgi:hypothetical protein
MCWMWASLGGVSAAKKMVENVGKESPGEYVGLTRFGQLLVYMCLHMSYVYICLMPYFCAICCRMMICRIGSSRFRAAQSNTTRGVFCPKNVYRTAHGGRSSHGHWVFIFPRWSSLKAINRRIIDVFQSSRAVDWDGSLCKVSTIFFGTNWPDGCLIRLIAVDLLKMSSW